MSGFHQNKKHQLGTVRRHAAQVTFDLLNYIWKRTIDEVVNPLASVAVDWVLEHLWAPVSQVPVLFASVCSSSKADSSHAFEILFSIFQERVGVQETIIIRLDFRSCISLSKFLDEGIQQINSSLSAKNKSYGDPFSSTPGGFAACASQASSLVLILERADHISTDVLEGIIHIFYGLRSSEPFKTSIRVAIVLGLSLGSIQALRSTWSAPMLANTFSTGIRLSEFHDMVQRFLLRIKTEIKFAGLLGFPEEFLKEVEDQAKQCFYSLEAVRKKLELFTVFGYSTIPLYMCVPVCLSTPHLTNVPNGAITIRLEAKSGGKCLKDCLNEIYVNVVSQQDSKGQVDWLINRFMNRAAIIIMHLLEPLKSLGDKEQDFALQLKCWNELCSTYDLQLILSQIEFLGERVSPDEKNCRSRTQKRDYDRPMIKRILQSVTQAYKCKLFEVSQLGAVSTVVSQSLNPSPVEAIFPFVKDEKIRMRKLSNLQKSADVPLFSKYFKVFFAATCVGRQTNLGRSFKVFFEKTMGDTECDCINCSEAKFLSCVETFQILGFIGEPKIMKNIKQVEESEESSESEAENINITLAEFSMTEAFQRLSKLRCRVNIQS